MARHDVHERRPYLPAVNISSVTGRGLGGRVGAMAGLPPLPTIVDFNDVLYQASLA